MFRLSPELKAKGEKAETDFRDWLNRSGVAFLYVEQSPVTVPDALRGRIKRPDYLVGIPHAGSLAFDVKAKSLYEGHFLFDVEEVQKLNRFARLFNLTVYFACLDAENDGRHWWVALADLISREPERRGKRAVLTYPQIEAHEVLHDRQDFMDAVIGLSEHALRS
jgi:Holliday junction resolvase